MGGNTSECGFLHAVRPIDPENCPSEQDDMQNQHVHVKQEFDDSVSGLSTNNGVYPHIGSSQNPPYTLPIHNGAYNQNIHHIMSPLPAPPHPMSSSMDPSYQPQLAQSTNMEIKSEPEYTSSASSAHHNGNYHHHHINSFYQSRPTSPYIHHPHHHHHLAYAAAPNQPSINHLPHTPHLQSSHQPFQQQQQQRHLAVSAPPQFISNDLAQSSSLLLSVGGVTSTTSCQTPAQVASAAPHPISSSTTGTQNSSEENDDDTSPSYKPTAHSQRRQSCGRRRYRLGWTEEETNYLMQGCRDHGVGNWKKILLDPKLKFNNRTAVDLKDRFRTSFPDEYARLYPNARTHKAKKHLSSSTSALQSGSHSSPFIASSLVKINRKERRAFTPEEDHALLIGFEKYGPAWSQIQRDETLNLGSRRSTDLRDRFRNAFPEKYAAAGYKGRISRKASDIYLQEDQAEVTANGNDSHDESTNQRSAQDDLQRQFWITLQQNQEQSPRAHGPTHHIDLSAAQQQMSRAYMLYSGTAAPPSPRQMQNKQ